MISTEIKDFLMYKLEIEKNPFVEMKNEFKDKILHEITYENHIAYLLEDYSVIIMNSKGIRAMDVESLFSIVIDSLIDLDKE